jgi:hypothetical protein
METKVGGAYRCQATVNLTLPLWGNSVEWKQAVTLAGNSASAKSTCSPFMGELS